jgi:hypothetical protein
MRQEFKTNGDGILDVRTEKIRIAIRGGRAYETWWSWFFTTHHAASITRHTVKISKGRKERLVANLLSCLNTGAQSPQAQGKENPSKELPRPELFKIEQNLCATCRGQCCEKGAEHAYLKYDTLNRFLSDHPEHSEQTAIQAYADCVPERAYASCCIYHSADGCALPEEMRSTTCITYFCQAIEQIRVMKLNTDHPILAISVGDYRPMRTLVIHKSETSKFKPYR